MVAIRTATALSSPRHALGMQRRWIALRRRLLGYPVIENATGTRPEAGSPRALLVYLSEPFLFASDTGSYFLAHQNRRQTRQIAVALGAHGWVVDVVDIRDQQFRPSKRYDMVVSHRVDQGHLADHLSRGALKVYLSSGINYPVNNDNVRLRYTRFRQRRSCPIEERGLHSDPLPLQWVSEADVIAGFGNAFTRETWCSEYDKPFHGFCNYGFRETPFLPAGRDWSSARTRFLFFASGPQVLKGLDLLLDVFGRRTDVHLYVCSSFRTEPDFVACYQRELFERPNIHTLGRIPVNGRQFRQLARLCNWVIHPSCSDAQTGSVVQCMSAGIVPVVTLETGIDVGDFGIQLEDTQLETLDRTVTKLASTDVGECRQRTDKLRLAAEAQHSERAFVARWHQIAGALTRLWKDQR